MASVDNPTLTRLVQYFEEFDRETESGRGESEKCRDYYDHKQWTDAEIAKLRARRQPVITVNRIKPKVDYMLGMERQQRTDPKAFPRTPMHEKGAEAVTDSIRFVCDANKWDAIRSECFEHHLIEGTAAVNIFAVDKGGKREIVIKAIPWDRFFYDAKSRTKDFSDCKIFGEFLWMDKADALEKWPDAKEIIEGAFLSEEISDTYSDTPRNAWADKTRERVRVCQAYYVERGTWMFAVYTESGFLEEPMPSPYVDETGQPVSAIVARSLFVDREGARYGFVKQYLDIQDEINHRRSKALHLLNVRQTWARKGIVDPNVFRAEMAKPDGHVEINDGVYGQDFGKFDTSDLAAGQFNLLAEAKNEIDAIGVNAAMSGKEDRDMSGRALLAKAQGGQVEVGPVMDCLRLFSNEVYRQVWFRIKQFWTEERWIRVTDDENAMQWVGINRKVTVADRLKELFGQVPPGYAMDPRLAQVIEVQNNVQELDVDIIIDSAPDSITIQQEQYEQLVQMFTAAPDKVPFEMVVEASSLRGKEKLLEMAKGNKEQQAKIAQMQQQVQQKTIELGMEDKEADIHKKHASAMKDEAQAQKTVVETQIAATPRPVENQQQFAQY